MQSKESPQQNLPIFKYREEIIKKTETESAIVISGLTGCGKSTQVPQYLLDAYPDANIAVCEPRRLAATSLALRVCEQRKTKLSSQVGYQIGLENKRSDRTRLVYMTYGILIQELLFKEKLDYDFIILDEVHERSLEMDFAFVILKKIINQNIRRKSSQKDNAPKTQKQPLALNLTKQASLQPSITSSQISNSTDTKAIKPSKRNLKLIIMSATLNSDQFQKYFAVNKVTGLIIEPQVIIRQPQVQNRQKRGNNERRRGNVDWETVASSKKEVEISYGNMEDYRQGVCIFIDQKSPYVVKEHFLEDFLPYFEETVPKHNYENKDEVRLEEKNFDWGYKLIEKAVRDIQYARKYASSQDQNKNPQQEGDILVFLPGLVQINKMKQILIYGNKLFAQKIVEVHSLFSEELYFKLFQSRIKNKIILATNIGESSITLPNCKVVIDYCLNRKAVKNDKEGISRFSTIVASLSNLIQRKGRVGRVSDGTVYRMITKSQFEKLQEFDVPEIKSVSLDMAILKTKKLQSTSKSHIFDDIYDIFLNVLEPPEIYAIQNAIDTLIHEDALQYVEESPNQNSSKDQSGKITDKKEKKEIINSGKKYDAKRLKITKVGEFMVSMPCELGISKLILMGIKLGISSIIIDIAAIILSTKSFFCHEERRHNIEQFMHSMIGYDKGDNNDYLLRQRLFDHWRSRFFIPFRDKYKKNQPKPEGSKITSEKTAETSFRIFETNDQVIQFDQNYKIVDSFARRHQSEEEKDFCKNRGVYANHMRELLRVSQTLKIRLEMIGVDKEKLNGFQAEAQLVLICLMYAFPDLICEVTFDVKKKSLSHEFKNGQHPSNKVHIPLIQGLTEMELKRYLQPQQQYDVKKQRDSLTISTYDHVLKKFYLPKFYMKAPIEKCSLLYKHCRQAKIKYPYEYSIHHGFSFVTILNESINKEILISPECFMEKNKLQSKYLISNNVIESKGKYMVAANALISHFELVIISMIVKKGIKLFLHPSGQFFSHISLNDKKFEIPLLLTEEQLTLINNLRELSKRKKEEDISSYKEQFNKEQLKTLSELFRFKNLKNAQEDWEQIFVEEEHNARKESEKEKQNEKMKENKKQKESQRQQSHKNNSLVGESTNRSLNNHFSFYQDNNTQFWIPIQTASQVMVKPFNNKTYYERYNDWKRYLLESTERQLKIYSTTQPVLICGYCHREGKLVEVASAHCYEIRSKLMKLNRYSGSWECPDSKTEDIEEAGLKIYCMNKHHIGNTLDPDNAQIDLLNIYLYIPFNQFYPLQKIDCYQSFQQIIEKAKGEGLNNLKREHEKSQEFECKICYSKQNHRKVFTRDEIIYQKGNRNKRNMHQGIKDPLWNAIISHWISNQHIQNRDKLKKSIYWD